MAMMVHNLPLAMSLSEEQGMLLDSARDFCPGPWRLAGPVVGIRAGFCPTVAALCTGLAVGPVV